MQGTITKKGTKWYIVVDLGKDEKGKRKQKWISGFRTKKEAQKKLPEVLQQINNSTFIDAENITVKEYLQYWLSDYAKPNVSPTTYERYSLTVSKVIDFMGNIKIQDIKPTHIQSFVTKLNRGDLAPSTVSSHYRTLNTAMNQAVKWRMIQVNPCYGVTPPKNNKTKMTVLEDHEVKKLFEATKDMPIYIVLLIAVTCGLRRGEILGLQWENIDFKNSTMSIENNVVRAGKDVVMKETKTSSGKRSVSIPANVLEVLKDVRKKQMEYRMLFGKDYHENNFVCTWPDGKPFSPGYITNTFSKLLKKLEIPAIRFHDLRHTHATILLKQGVHPKVVQERLGHSKISMTLDTYSHVLPTMQKEAAEKIRNIFTNV